MFFNAEEKEKAIQLLAEQMSCASSAAIDQVCMASNYEFSHKVKNNSTNGSDKFNDMFYEVAEKLIESVG